MAAAPKGCWAESSWPCPVPFCGTPASWTLLPLQPQPWLFTTQLPPRLNSPVPPGIWGSRNPGVGEPWEAGPGASHRI